MLPLNLRLCATTIQTKTPFLSYRPPNRSLLRPKINSLSKQENNVKKTVSFDGIVHFIDEEIFVTFVGTEYGEGPYLQHPAKVEQINRERKNNSSA